MTRPTSLGRRLIIGSVLCTTAAVALAAVLAWVAARSSLYQALDRSLWERREHMSKRGIFLHPRDDHRPPPEYGYARGRPLFQIIDPDGAESMRSSALNADVSLIELVGQEDRLTDVDIGDGRRARALRFTLPVRSSWSHAPDLATAPRATAVIAVDSTDADIELRRLAWILGGVGTAAMLLAVALAFWLRRTVLRPVAHIAAGIVAIAPGDPEARVPTDGVPAELAQIVDRLHDLLDRLHATLHREKATLAAIAHELRTPVAGLRTTLEFARRRDDGERAHSTYAACHEVVLGMQTMIDHLLQLARIEAGQLAIQRGPTEAVAVVRAAWDAVAGRAAERGISVAWTLPDTALVGLDAAWLRLVIGNLCDNLISHAPSGAAAHITLEAHANCWHLSVDNPAPGPAIDPEQAVLPFWRSDTARGVGRHCGLGLALCQRVVRLVEGRLVIATADQRFRVTVVLPMEETPAAPLRPGEGPHNPPSMMPG